ncbi:MAG: hypothetical protein OQJ87_12145 [Rhodospirillales bacterium]|nr:hypothetical protein [Rhodospirillales bacterium]
MFVIVNPLGDVTMKKIFITLALVGLLGALGGCVTTQDAAIKAGGERLTAAQIKTVFSGVEVDSIFASEVSAHYTFNADGTFIYTNMGGCKHCKRPFEGGEWWAADNDRLCLQFPLSKFPFAQGTWDHCHAVVKHEGFYKLFDSVVHQQRMQWKVL